MLGLIISVGVVIVGLFGAMRFVEKMQIDKDWLFLYGFIVGMLMAFIQCYL